MTDQQFLLALSRYMAANPIGGIRRVTVEYRDGLSVEAIHTEDGEIQVHIKDWEQ